MSHINRVLALIEKRISDGFQIIRKEIENGHIDSDDNNIKVEISASGTVFKLKLMSEGKPIYSISLSKKR